MEIIDHTLIIRTGSYPDRLLLDLRHWVVHHTILRFRSFHSGRNFGLLFFRLPYSR
jgi:hypothetical protein